MNYIPCPQKKLLVVQSLIGDGTLGKWKYNRKVQKRVSITFFGDALVLLEDIHSMTHSRCELNCVPQKDLFKT